VRVGIYARVSTEAQEARGTIGSQLEALRARVASEGDELVAEFVDDGYSGARLDRPGLDALRDAAEAGTIEAVWCLSPDRMARSFAYQMLILDELARLGVAVRFTDSPPLDDDPEARLLIQVQGVIAEYEKAKFAERERRGKLYRARAGEVLSRKVPYGYRRVPRGPDGPAHVVVHEPEATVVRRIFSEFLAGRAIRRIVIDLSAERVTSPDGKAQWVLATVGRMLRNEAYVGRLYWNRTHTTFDPALGRNRQRRRPRDEWVEIPIPAIIGDDTFEAVQRAAADNTAFSPRRTEPGTFLLRRLARCGNCGVKLASHRANRQAGMARYYLCPRHDPVRAGGEDQRCPERRIRADELDAFVFAEVANLLAQPAMLAAGEGALAERAPAPDDELLAAQLSRLARRLVEADGERRRLADIYQAGVIDQAELTRRAAELDVRRRRFDAERQALADQHADLAQNNRLTRRIEAFADRALAALDTLDFDGRQQLLRLVLEDVRVQGWRVELRLRIPLDATPPDDPPPHTRPSSGRAKRGRSTRGPRPTKEGVSSNDGLRSIGQRLPHLPRLPDHPGVSRRSPPAGDREPQTHRPRRQQRTVPPRRQPAPRPRQPRADHPRARAARRPGQEMTRADNSHHLRRVAAARHDTAVKNARRAIETIDRAGNAITFTTVARTAGVSRGWLYNQTDLRDAIIGLRRDEPAPDTSLAPAAQRATSDSLRQRLDSARLEITRLRAHNATLHEQLARSLGQERLRR
jgi:site-specific DNA recombinase